MKSTFYADQTWLKAIPNFRDDLKATDEDLRSRDALVPEDIGYAMRQLSTRQLSISDAERLGKAFNRWRGDLGAPKNLTPFRLGILGHVNTDHFVNPLIAVAPRHNLHLEVVNTPFGMLDALGLSGVPDFAGKTPVDGVFLALDRHAIGLDAPVNDAEQSEAVCQAAIDRVQAICDRLKTDLAVPVFLQNLVADASLVHSSFDAGLPGTERFQVDLFNRKLAALCAQGAAILFNQQELANNIGIQAWFNPVLWHLAKMPFDQEYVVTYCDRICAHIAAVRGKTRRVMVLDLDNTLWGGIIGDDGLEGIKIGQGTATGEAHLAIQFLANTLSQRGVALTVSSKNTHEIAIKAFQEHSGMLLKEDDIAMYMINWDDKASNIKHIAETLNLGLDSVVFLDDNPAERQRVRQMLPEVAVPEVGDNAALYPAILSAAGYFETVSFSDEDRQRAAMYAANAKRSAVAKNVGNYEDYLNSLEMKISFAPFDEAGRKRTVQLISKSNQFNLTTRRYSDVEIAALEKEEPVFTRQIRLTDAFGDNGMIAVVICRDGTSTDLDEALDKSSGISDDALVIDTWLMSCRVLGRDVERRTLNDMVDFALANGKSRLVGLYKPTERNGIVSEHYSKLGFEKVTTSEAGAETWQLELKTFEKFDLPYFSG